jgi:signal transduction histidine kinase
MRLTKLNFASTCNEVYLCFVQQAESKNITYTFECTNDQLELYADREKIEIALYNLVSNALKFTPRGGSVSFIVDEKEKDVEVSIIDTGCGIPEDIGRRLFEKFYQVKGRAPHQLQGLE